MRCLGKDVILRVEEKDAVTSGTIIIPKRGDEAPVFNFTVAMIGPEVTKVAVGEVVLKPEVTVLRHTRSNRGEPEFDLLLDDDSDAIVVCEDDIRVVLSEAPEDVEDE